MGVMSVLSFARQLVSERLGPCGIAVDATVGNGVDTCFLAERVGPRGTVYGFDIQQEAIMNTRRRLIEQNLLASTEPDHERIRLLLAGHETMASSIEPAHYGKLNAVMFNLGYLPHAANHQIITLPETTLAALNAACELLQVNGVITVVLYPGHEGGQTEAQAVEQWAAGLPQAMYDSLLYRVTNRSANAPYLLAVVKKNKTKGAGH